MYEKFGCIVTVHLDPVVLDDPLVNELRALSIECAKEIDESFSLHDFRMTKGENRMNLIFDLLIPTDCPLTPAEAQKAVGERIHERNPSCYCVIRAEHPFV
jgi:hypothetical protein